MIGEYCNVHGPGFELPSVDLPGVDDDQINPNFEEPDAFTPLLTE